MMFLLSVGACRSHSNTLVDVINAASGLVFVYKISKPSGILNPATIQTGIPYLSISVSLNVLLTLMISLRLMLHSRRVQRAIGAGEGRMYKTVVTMIIESSALYAVSSLLFIGTWGAGSWVSSVFSPILEDTQVRTVFTSLSDAPLFWDAVYNHCDKQVIAPLLITFRVANRSALTSDTIGSGKVSSVLFGSCEGSTGGIGTCPDRNPADSVVGHGNIRGESSVGADATINVHFVKPILQRYDGH
jgi:hypothetical protein